MRLSEVLHAHIPTLRLHSTFRDAVDKMDIYQFPALVVTDEDSQVLGIVTEGDLCRFVQQRGSVARLANTPIESVITFSPTCATTETEISEALHLMLNSGLTILPVLESDRLAGIVLRVDLMQAVLMDACNATHEANGGATS